GAISKINEEILFVSPALVVIEYNASSYLFYVLSESEFFNYLSTLEAGTTYPSVKDKDILNYQIPLPPLPEQERIATVLSQIDEVIEKEKAYKEKLEGIKKGLMEDLLTGKVRVNHLIEEESKDEIGRGALC
ncbi:MAG: restriction endonuclease subunit S, partial [Caldisericum sp.]|uniref:restriction endonuclease subunit S n=1 Tax=Caldisericum sp. TaxID=2499687 RepID=UPI003D12EC25